MKRNQQYRIGFIIGPGCRWHWHSSSLDFLFVGLGLESPVVWLLRHLQSSVTATLLSKILKWENMCIDRYVVKKNHFAIGGSPLFNLGQKMADLLILFGDRFINKEAHTLSKNIFPLINAPKMTKLQSKWYCKNGKRTFQTSGQCPLFFLTKTTICLISFFR